MKFTIAAVAFAAGVSATYPAANATAYTTEVVTSYETYCPGPTQITYGTNTYTVTEVCKLNRRRSEEYQRLTRLLGYHPDHH